MVPSFPALKCLFISYYAPLSFKTQVELTGAKHIPFPEVTECYSGPFMGREDFLAVISLVFLGQAKEAIDDIMKGLMADRPDVIISDALALAGRLAAWKMNLPLVMMFTSYAPGKNFSIFRTFPEYPGESRSVCGRKNGRGISGSVWRETADACRNL